MIDFVKVQINLASANILDNDLLDLKSEVSNKTGEVITSRKIANFRNLKFTVINDQHCYISGSLHKYWHDGINYDSFSINEIVNAINDLRDRFNIDLSQAELRNLEVGVNLRELPVPTGSFIRSVIIHKGEPFNRIKNLHRKSIGIEVYHQRYGIKIYDKGRQYSLPYPVLRFEIKFSKMHDLNALGIYNLFDLCDPENYKHLKKYVLDKFNEILLIEPQLQKKKLKPVEERNLPNYTNPKYWENLKYGNPKNYDYHRKRYQQIISNYIPYPVQTQVADLMNKTWNKLAQPDENTLAKLTTFRKKKFSHFNPSYKELKYLNIPEPYKIGRRCKITGIDISDQRPGSKFISAKNVGYKEAHKVRNQDSNPRNNLKRRVRKYIGCQTLFNMNDFLKLTKEQKEMLSFWKGTRHEIHIDSNAKPDEHLYR